MGNLVYLDNNATTKVAPEVVAAMVPVMEKSYGNPSSRHQLGTEAAGLMQKAREQLAALLHCHASEIIFTSCGTESNNLAIRGVAEVLPSHKRHIITSAVEHPAVNKVMEYLSQKGYRVTRLKVDHNGMLDLAELTAKLSDDTGLVSIMYANNETGVMFPIEEIGRIVREKGVIFHVDAVQAMGKIPMDLTRCPVDLLSLSGHKFHAPKGIGALFIREGIRLQPQMLGGHQEQGIRGGTEAMPNIVALGVAADLAAKSLNDSGSIRVKRDRLENWILENIPATRLNGDKQARLPNTSNIAFRDLEAEAILLSLSRLGICVSPGAACFSGSVKPSETLLAMKVPHNYLPGSIRFSLSRSTTDEEVDYVIAHLPGVIEKLRGISGKPGGRK